LHIKQTSGRTKRLFQTPLTAERIGFSKTTSTRKRQIRQPREGLFPTKLTHFVGQISRKPNKIHKNRERKKK
jgi:hypothetical protein